MRPIAHEKGRADALFAVCRAEKAGQAATEIETAGICLRAFVAGEDTPEGDVGGMIVAAMALDLHALTLRGSE